MKLNSTVDQVTRRIAGEPRERYAALQQQLKCGSNCGSCMPELRQLVAQVSPAERQEAA